MLRSRWVSRLGVVLTVAMLFIGAHDVAAQSSASSAQADALKSMSPAERSALMKQLGLDSEAGGSSADPAAKKNTETRSRRTKKNETDVDVAEAEIDPVTGLPRP
ncbi:MAG: hypothetical protein RL603_97, partial [Pseudomonadota bacterium]